MDEGDHAAKYQAQDNAAALTRRRPEGPEATGFCLCCGEIAEARWCDVRCRDEWADDQKRRR